MRFNLRILLLLTLSIALIPLVATALTYYIHESPDQRKIAIRAWPLRDIHALNLRGSTFLADDQGLDWGTRMYLRLRSMFCPPTCSAQQIALLESLKSPGKQSHRIDTIPLSKEWRDVAEGVQARTNEVRVTNAEKSMSYPLQWAPETMPVAIYSSHVLFLTRSTPQYFVLAAKNMDGPFFATSLITENKGRLALSHAGDFFFKTLLITAFTVYAIFFWLIHTFSRRHAPPKQIP